MFKSTRSSGYSGYFSVGTYSLIDNSFSSVDKSFTTDEEGNMVISDFAFIDSSFNKGSDYFYFGLDLTNVLQGVSASSARVLMNNIGLVAWDPDYIGESILPFQYFASPNSLPVYSCYAEVEYSATGIINTAHINGFKASNTISLGSPFTISTHSTQLLNCDFNLNFNVPDASEFVKYEGSYTRVPDSVYNVTVDSCKIYCIFNPDFMINRQNQLFGNTFYNNDSRLAVFINFTDSASYSSSFFVNVNSKGSSEDSFISSSFASLSQGLSSVASNMTTQFNDVKTKITQSTNTITTKIDTMSQDIQTGLQNVITSAQQNTQNIINTVTTKVDEVKTGITEVKDSIIDLPDKIQEMLIGLVVPDEETINAKYAEFDELLSSRFGLIYQSADIIHDFADSFQTQAVMTADAGGIITMPSVTVNLAGTQFTFGGYDVDIIPDGFEFLQQALRLAISMVCTVVFVNMCKNKLEAILK